MIGWIFRALMIVAGMIAALFVERDALNFSIVQMAITLMLFVAVIAIFAFSSPQKWLEWLKNRFKSL